MTESHTLTQIDTPSLLVNLPVLQRNIDSMAALARRTGRALRPMIKTHKSKDIAQIQIIPNHACPVVNLFAEMIGIRDGHVERIICVDARGGVH